MTLDLIRIAIVSPITALRAGLRTLLTPDAGINIVTEQASISNLDQMTPPIDVLIITFDSSNSDQVLDYSKRSPSTAVLLLVTKDSQPVQAFSRLVESLTIGILPIESSSEEIISAVRALDQGLFIGAPALAKKIFLQPREREYSLLNQDVESLTQRELVVLQWLAQGLSNKQIAIKLNISEHTVKFHISSIYTKLGVNNRAEVVRVGVTTGLITL
jgi:two-component system, NarL family, response regulator YdfI